MTYNCESKTQKLKAVLAEIVSNPVPASELKDPSRNDRSGTAVGFEPRMSRPCTANEIGTKDVLKVCLVLKLVLKLRVQKMN